MEVNKTQQQYQEVISNCKNLFLKKMEDYGVAWRVLRLPSFTDQIYIKVKRIRTLQELATQKVRESIPDEFIGVINYSIMALIQIEQGVAEQPDISKEEAKKLYEREVNTTYQLMQNKNHDYGEAWRDLRVSSMTDLIYQKLLRIKEIENNQGKTIISEGIDANYRDIINYAIFCLITIDSNQNN